MYLALWLISRWRLPATPAFSLPVAVILKRLLAPDLVFSFGISLRGENPVLWSHDAPPWHAIGQAAPTGRCNTGKGAGLQAACVSRDASPRPRGEDVCGASP